MKKIVLISLLCPIILFASGLPELPTVIYGSVHNRCGGRDVLVTHGELTWTIRHGTKARTLSGKLGNLVNGEYSYRMTIPHEIKVEGKSLSAAAMGVSKEPETVDFVRPVLDGIPVYIANPEKARQAFSTDGRARALRIDLRIREPMPDSDGDNLADWWEKTYGLDPDSPQDATADPDGDDWNNRKEFELGAAPSTDNRIPRLRTAKFTVYASARNGLWLECLDSDTASAQINVHLKKIPQNGTLWVGDREWEIDSAVSLHTLQKSGLFYEGDPSDSFRIALDDSDHEEQVHAVQLLAFEDKAGTSDETFSSLKAALLYCQSHRLSARQGAAVYTGTVWDFSQRKRAFNAEENALAGWIIGSHFDDTLAGSQEVDVFWPMGGDDTLDGGEGSDVFVLGQAGNGADRVRDFEVDKDAVDLRTLLRYSSMPIDELIEVGLAESGTNIGVESADGDSVKMALEGAADFGTLGEALTAGRLLVPDALMPSCVQITALRNAEETGEQDGILRIWRTGDTHSAEVVKLRIGGSARPGVDYRELPDRVTLAVGQREKMLSVSPVRDLEIEGPEHVTLSLEDSNAYYLGKAKTADILVHDLEQTVSLRVVAPIAVQGTKEQATVMIERSGQIGRKALLELKYSGTLVNGTHIEELPRYLEFAAYETRKGLDITPLQDVSFNETLVLLIEIVPADTITVAEPATAEIFLCADSQQAETWRQILIAEDADPDGDGMSTAEENKLGSDPASPTLRVQQGWNLVSVPCKPEEGTTLADQIGADLADDLGVVWTWDGAKYVVHHGPLMPGKGYFVHALASEYADIQGTIEEKTVEPQHAGWNLLGPYHSVPARAVPIEWTGYSLADGKYTPVEKSGLHRCQGFWLYEAGE